MMQITQDHSPTARLTSQLIVSDVAAVLAFSLRRDSRGPDGETDLALLLATEDGGVTWKELPWRRSFWMWLTHVGYPVWPPESVSVMEWSEDACLEIVFRDEWVPFETGGESLWRGRFRHGRWTATRIRYMDYDNEDTPGALPASTLDLPETIRPPEAWLLQR